MEQGQLLVAPPPKHPLEVFSAEVWTMILEKIEESKDVWNMANAHPLFRGILQEKKEAWKAVLFSVAIIPQLKGRLGVNELLNLRQVSRDLKNTVDELLESGNMPFRANGGCFCCRDVSFDIRSDFNCAQLLAKMRNNPDAKLVGGCVQVRVTPDFLSGRQAAFLEAHGKKILDLIVKLEDANHPLTPLEALEYLQFILEKAPNLKKLSVYFHGMVEHELGLPFRIWEKRVAQHLRRKPFPKLANLMFLLLHRSDGVEREGMGRSGLLRGILETYKNQVESLGLLNLENPPPREMPMLTNLYLWTYIYKPQESLGLLQAPLCKVSINDGKRIQMSDFFRLMAKFGNTLKEILIIDVRDDDGVAPEVQLPKLEKLRMLNFHISSFAVFDVLFNFPRLRQVELEFLIGTNSGASLPGAVLVESYLKEDGSLDKARFKESPIWQRLSYLQSINLRKLQRPNDRCFPEID